LPFTAVFGRVCFPVLGIFLPIRTLLYTLVKAGNTLPEQEAPMDLQLTNKKALVTGSTAGIGFAIASLV
jgi:hypothetical protein